MNTSKIAMFLAPLFTVMMMVQLVGAQPAPGANTLSISGEVISLNGAELIVKTPSGNSQFSIGDKTIIRNEVPIKFSDITPGAYLGTTATKQPDGTFLASEVHVFSEDQRGTGEGHRPLGSAPQSGATMTNANVERVEDVTVQNVKGRKLNLKYKGGEVEVLVPPDIPLVKRVVTDRNAIKAGSQVSITAVKENDRLLSAQQITIRAAKP